MVYSNRIKKNKEILNILKLLAPGTQLRAGVENILRAKTGGLVVLNNNDQVMKVVDGGFYINADYNPAYIYELAKMDGAIILSADLKKIICANTQLIPDYTLSTNETGTRHRTAQRMAKQFDVITIAISQRRTMITIYKGDIKYVLRESAVILQRANQAIQTLEKYISVLDRAVSSLNLLEFQDIVTLFEVITSIQRTELVLRIVAEIEMFIIELGNEGRLISMQLSELIHNVEKDGLLIIRDYCKKEEDYLKMYDKIEALSEEELLDMDLIAKILGFGEYSIVDTMLSTRGYRTMSKIQRLPNAVIDNVVAHFHELRFIMDASLEELDQVEGIGEARAKSIRNGLRRLKEQSLLNYKA